ncbi:MAG TPA: hypothetical protein VNJ54_15620 [Plantibacter sp.]|uniref:hypothetical protein n=1 Tax=unclassified Plantibacter TaxID=2624265 RepID=UPI002BBF7B3B|nr:hypothetical protein [Plantibacter sp.]
MRTVQIIAALTGLVLIVLSVASQVQGLVTGSGFLEQQQGWLAIVGAALVVVSFIALGLQKQRRSQRSR